MSKKISDRAVPTMAAHHWVDGANDPYSVNPPAMAARIRSPPVPHKARPQRMSRVPGPRRREVASPRADAGEPAELASTGSLPTVGDATRSA